jgi:DNA gyrase subunit A
VENLNVPEYLEKHCIILCTKNGIIKKTTLEAYSRPRVNGINAITIKDDDYLLEAKLTDGNSQILMGLKSGRAIRFHESNVRPMGRNASGVTGVRFDNSKDEVIGMVCIQNLSDQILVVTENGYGKRTDVEDYRITNRGGKGVKAMQVTEKTGVLVAIKSVTDDQDLMIITKSGVTIRLSINNMRVLGRVTQGVRLIKLEKEGAIASVCPVDKQEEEELGNEENLNNESINPETE